MKLGQDCVDLVLVVLKLYQLASQEGLCSME